MCDGGADDFDSTIRRGRMLSVLSKRRKQRNVSGRRLQSSVEGVRPSSDATLHRGGRLARLLNPGRITSGIMAHAIRICDSTRTNPCRTASSNYLRNNLPGRFWGVWDGAVRQIVAITSSASLEVGRRALLVTCHHNDSRKRSNNLGTCSMRARVGTSTTTRTSPL